jgi:hypothetical protein
MLSAEKNRLLTEVGPGTQMGDYLRRYWHPIAGASEFDTKSVRPIRLFGEDLVLYKDLSGNYGLSSSVIARIVRLIWFSDTLRNAVSVARITDGSSAGADSARISLLKRSWMRKVDSERRRRPLPMRFARRLECHEHTWGPPRHLNCLTGRYSITKMVLPRS